MGSRFFLVRILQSFPADMKMRFATTILCLLCLLGTAGPLLSQNHVRRAMKRAREQQNTRFSEDSPTPVPGSMAGFMAYHIDEKGDTVYFDTLEPVWVFGRGTPGRGKDWRQYYRLVYNFSKAYPYALMAGKIASEVDARIEGSGLEGTAREKYINQVQSQLFRDFEKSLRNLTITQGMLIVKLIDREMDKTTFKVIKEYKSGFVAGFWQGIGRLFGYNLKTRYDPEGDDKDIEELVQIWKAGKFRDLYFSIFWEEPPKPSIPEKYL